MRYKWQALASLIFLLFSVVGVYAQPTAPDSMPGCVYNATPPTLTDRQTTVWQCDINGKLITNSTGAGPGVLNLASYLTTAQLTTAQAGANTQDLTTPITTWLAACPATGCQYVVPPGYFYSATCNFTLPNPFSLVGAGSRNAVGTQWVSVIACGSTSAHLFNVTTLFGLFKDVSLLQNGGTAVSGSSGIWVCNAGQASTCPTNAGGNYNQQVSYENIQVDGFYDSVDVGVGTSWHLANSNIQNCVHWCIRVRNVVLADAGDWFVTGNNLYPANGGSSAVRWESSGNGHIINNSIVANSGSIIDCVTMDTTGTSSVQAVISDNKCESVRGVAINVLKGYVDMVISHNILHSVAPSQSSFTASIAANTNQLVVTGSPTNTLAVGQVVIGANGDIPKGTYITSLNGNSGTVAGTYLVNNTFLSAIASESMTGNSPAIVCIACNSSNMSNNAVESVVVNNPAPAILIGTTSISVVEGNTNANGFASPLMLTNSSNIEFVDPGTYTLAQLPDPAQLASGSTAWVIDGAATPTPAMLQPFAGGGSLTFPVVSNGTAWVPSAIPGTYVGPGDIGIATPKAWWGLRAYSAARAGNNAANICNVSSDTTCTDIKTLSNGQLDMVTLQKTVGGPGCVGNGDCNVKILYDQSNQLACSGATACDLSQATVIQRPTIYFSSVAGGTQSSCGTATFGGGGGRQPAMCLSTAHTTYMTTTGTITIAQPYTVYGVGARQATSTYNTILSNAAGSNGLYLGNIANRADLLINGGTPADKLFVQTDGLWQVIVGVGDSAGAGIKGYVNGVVTNFGATGAGGFATAETMHAFSDATNGVDKFWGPLPEFGIWNSAASAGNVATLTTNARLFYGGF